VRYRKKPIVIDAFLLTEELVHRCLFDGEKWPSKLHFSGSYHAGRREILGGGVMVSTLEGYLTASIGDWIITGIKGERYPCKPDIFAATYEPVDERFTPEEREALEHCAHITKEVSASYDQGDNYGDIIEEAAITLRRMIEEGK
jgi:hypothetical protein